MWAWRYKYNNIIHNINGLIMNYYAVHAGRKPGIYNTWKECEAQVKHFSQAKYKKFSTLEEAQCFVNVGISSVNNKNKVCLTNCHCDTFDKQKNDGTLSLKRKAKSSDILSTKLLKLQDDDSDEKCPVVYTDGACSSNGKNGSSAGYGVWWGENHPLNLSCKLKGIQTNQRAEIAAISAAIQQAKTKGYKKLKIKTDSMFVINCLTKWAPSWKRRGWIKSDGKEVVHKKEFLEILDNMKSVKVEFDHVFGHRGVHGNEMADQLAVAGAKLKDI